jgi:hypothetical protein
MEQRKAKAEIPPNGMEISRLLTENSLMREELTRTKRALEIARDGLSDIEEDARGMNMAGRIATSTLATIRKELGE